MNIKSSQKLHIKVLICLVFLAFLLSACDVAEDIYWEISDTVEEVTKENDWEKNNSEEVDLDDENSPAPSLEEPVVEESSGGEPPTDGDINSKWDLWSSEETQLRGANIWQSLVIQEFDGDTFKGSGHIGPPFSQEDFDDLTALGANYVTISGPGLYFEEPPYDVDWEAVENLDNLLEMIANADMFATISFRTGPGRSECTFWCDEDDPEVAGLFNDTVWEDQSAKEAWVEMWQFTAERYLDNPIVVGYKLMVEPNAAAVFFDLWEPDEFYPDYAGTTYDWNQFYPYLIAGIREVDTETPILVNAEGFSAIEWLPALEIVDNPYVVYIVHQYQPFDEYTHQEPGGQNTYPGYFDLNWDGNPDGFDHNWLDEELLSPVDEFTTAHGVPVGVDEFGINRWVPGGALYMNDLMGLFEERGINSSVWEWSTSWSEFEAEVHDMNFRFGPDPNNRSNTESNLMDVIKEHWALNTFRPSNVPWK